MLLNVPYLLSDSLAFLKSLSLGSHACKVVPKGTNESNLALRTRVESSTSLWSCKKFLSFLPSDDAAILEKKFSSNYQISKRVHSKTKAIMSHTHVTGWQHTFCYNRKMVSWTHVFLIYWLTKQQVKVYFLVQELK